MTALSSFAVKCLCHSHGGNLHLQRVFDVRSIVRTLCLRQHGLETLAVVGRDHGVVEAWSKKRTA